MLKFAQRAFTVLLELLRVDYWYLLLLAVDEGDSAQTILMQVL